LRPAAPGDVREHGHPGTVSIARPAPTRAEELPRNVKQTGTRYAPARGPAGRRVWADRRDPLDGGQGLRPRWACALGSGVKPVLPGDSQPTGGPPRPEQHGRGENERRSRSDGPAAVWRKGLGAGTETGRCIHGDSLPQSPPIPTAGSSGPRCPRARVGTVDGHEPEEGFGDAVGAVKQADGGDGR